VPIDRRTLLATAGATAAASLVPTATALGKVMSRHFPPGFLWGTATAGHQVEGNNTNSDIWLAENVTPTLFAERSGDAVSTWCAIPG